MDRPGYTRLPRKLIPEEIIQQYKLNNIVHDIGHTKTLLKVCVGYMGYQWQANWPRISSQNVQGQMVIIPTNLPLIHGNIFEAQLPSPLLWIILELILLGSSMPANHFVKTLKKYHDITMDWSDNTYVGTSLNWDHKKRILNTRVPNFVQMTLHKFQHPSPTKPHHVPAKATPINYGANIQASVPYDDTFALPKRSNYGKTT